jgi:hypothetical protein
MPRGPELSPSTRSRIYSLRSDANLSYNNIAIHFPSIPRSTIIYTCKKESQRGRDNYTCKRSGRPRILSNQERDLIYDYIHQHLSYRYYKVLDLVDYKISELTLRALLKDLSLRK